MRFSDLVTFGAAMQLLSACGARSPYYEEDAPSCGVSNTTLSSGGGHGTVTSGGIGNSSTGLPYGGTNGSSGGTNQSVTTGAGPARGGSSGITTSAFNAGGVSVGGAGGAGGIVGAGAAPRGGAGVTSDLTTSGGSNRGGNANGSSAATNGGATNSAPIGGTTGISSDGGSGNSAAVGGTTSSNDGGAGVNGGASGNPSNGGAANSANAGGASGNPSDGGAANAANAAGSGNSANAGGASGSPSDGGSANSATSAGTTATSPGGAGPWPGCVCGQSSCGTCPATAMVHRGSYDIDATETTNAEYAQFINANVSITAQPAVCQWNLTYVPNISWPVVGKDNLPVTWVDWCDAYAYCAWAGKRLCGAIGGGATPYNSVKDPLVSQWFAACTNNGANTYPYGSTYDGSTCNGAEHGIATVGEPTLLVAGSLSACQVSGQGIYDMSGNAFEWEDSCSDWTGEDDICRVRGGSYFSDIASVLACTSASTLYLRNTVRSSIGFRCCRDN